MMYFVLSLLLILTLASTVDRLHNSMTVPSTDLMMDHLHRMLQEGTVSNDQFTMVRRALAGGLNNPANGPHEEKIHEIINTILKELEKSYLSFSARENATKQDLVKQRADSIKVAQENTEKYEEKVEEATDALNTKQKAMDELLLKLEEELRQARSTARDTRNKFQAQLKEAEKALEDAQVQEENTIKNAQSEYEAGVKDLKIQGVSVRKGVCDEYRQMKELRKDVNEVDKAFKSTNFFTPQQVALVCDKGTCSYQIISKNHIIKNRFNIGKPFNGTLKKCIEKCTGNPDCKAFSRRNNVGDNEVSDCWFKSNNSKGQLQRHGRYNTVSCTHAVGENKYEIANTGTWGGYCTCPDGSKYAVGDNFDACGSLACVNGQSGECHKRDGEWSRKKVTCGIEL